MVVPEINPQHMDVIKYQKERLGTVLYNLFEAIRYLAIMIKPFMPETSDAIFAQTNMNANDYDTLTQWGGLEPGIVTNEAKPLFQRIDKDEMFKEIEARQKAAQEAEKANNAKVAETAAKEEVPGIAKIDFEDFAKVELRVAEIKTCEEIKRAKKLLKLTLDDGEGERTVVSGIKPWYSPEDLVGHKVVIVANLKPATLCGIESEGMIIAADVAENDVKVLFVDDFPTGATFR